MRLNGAAVSSLIALLVLAISQVGFAATPVAPPASQPIGGERFDGWSGLKIDSGIGTLPPADAADFQYEGESKWYTIGFRLLNDGTRDWREYCGLQFQVRSTSGKPLQLAVDLFTPPPALRQEYLPNLHANAQVAQGSPDLWQTVTLAWPAFGLNPSQHATLQFIRRLSIANQTDTAVELRSVRLVRAPLIAITAEVRGKATAADSHVEYQAWIANCSDEKQGVDLRIENVGWQKMASSIDPPHLLLAAGESRPCTVNVSVPAEGIPPGGHETQTLLAICNDGEAARLDFITARDVEGPSILHTSTEWDAVRQNVKNFDWAKAAENDILQDADSWQVPQASVPPNNYSTAEKHVFTFPNPNFPLVQTAAEAWQLTRDPKYAEKVATFLRRLSDEKTGYPTTFAGTNMGSPQEGQNFQSVAIAYDAIRDARVLTDADRQQIEHTFRLFMQTYETDLTVGNVGNWSTAAATAGLMCALSMGDLSAAQRYITGPCGFTDYLSKGIMADGWWWECSTSYNFWVASELTQSALACRPWGIDLLNLQVPASYAADTIITPWALNPPYGISFQKWGPNRRSTRSIKQLWDAVPAAADYRGIAFGMNDGHGERVGGSRLELAYYAFRDPAYAPFIKLANNRDLIYGVADLPEDSDQPYTQSGYAENLGYALLRSQTPNRPIREQIQAVAKIGSQGGFHGHFDRVSLDNITRYGRSFWNPEAVWWGYPNFMYKFFVQTSVSHNMVVVDQKMQEAVPSTQPLFHSGKLMQVAVQETDARWSDPPFGGMQYFRRDTFADQMRKNMQSIPAVTDRQYGELGPYSEPIFQRRMTIVTDDYIVIADYLKGNQPHTFDNLLQMKGLVSLDARDKQLLRHDSQWNPDPHSSAQFVTDCDWYSASAPAVGRFHINYAERNQDRDLEKDLNTPGVLNLDVRCLWPSQQQLMLATPPMPADTSQWVQYEVTGDGQSLAKGESGVWILGSVDVDVPVAGIKQLTLSVSSNGAQKKTLFWNNPRFVNEDGKEETINTISDSSNVDQPPAAGQDYYGGHIRISGTTGKNALPTQPIEETSPAVIHIAIPTGMKRFKATLGGDYPLGNDPQPRKVFVSRVQGTEAQFLTVIEPYENKPMITTATATGPDSLRIELADGRVQELQLHHFDGASDDIGVSLHQTTIGGKACDETVGTVQDPAK